MTGTSKDARRLKTMIRQLLADHQPPDAEPIEDEALVLLVTGRTEELPEAQRRHLLQCIAENPRLARLVRQLYELQLRESAKPRKGPR